MLYGDHNIRQKQGIVKELYQAGGAQAAEALYLQEVKVVDLKHTEPRPGRQGLGVIGRSRHLSRDEVVNDVEQQLRLRALVARRLRQTVVKQRNSLSSAWKKKHVPGAGVLT